jgi:hypothetical protein
MDKKKKGVNNILFPIIYCVRCLLLAKKEVISRVFRPLLCALSPAHLPLQLGLVQMLLQSQPNELFFHVFRLLEITMRESSLATAMVADEEKVHFVLCLPPF